MSEMSNGGRSTTMNVASHCDETVIQCCAREFVATWMGGQECAEGVCSNWDRSKEDGRLVEPHEIVLNAVQGAELRMM